jgi:hypothetical protein
MYTFKEMRDELLARLIVANNSTLYTDARLSLLIKHAYIWVTDQYLWPQLERAKYTNTAASQYYYDNPTTFKTDCVTRVIVNELEYDRKNFEDFLDYKQNYPTDVTKRIFADYGRQIFLFPTPTAILKLEIWGLIQPEPLSADADMTIFSDSDENGNEAIVRKALSVAIGKTNNNLALSEENEAKSILATIYNKILQRQQRDQRLDHAFFNVSDMFGHSGSSDTGRFSE